MDFEAIPPSWRWTAALALVNLLACAAFAIDKAAARRDSRRVRESTLLGLALIGGIVGAVAGQQIFRHKTRKEPFRTRLHAIAAMQAVVAVLLAVPQSRNWILGLLLGMAG
jgi:uncharacterized membrane protein YsdA (DUF1294 family)